MNSNIKENINGQQIEIVNDNKRGRTYEKTKLDKNPLPPVLDPTGDRMTFSISVGNKNTVVSESGNIDINGQHKTQFKTQVKLSDVSNRVWPSISCFTKDSFLCGETAISKIGNNRTTSQDHLLTSSRLMCKINETEKEILNLLFNKSDKNDTNKQLTSEEIKQYEDILYKAKQNIKKNPSTYNLTDKNIKDSSDGYLEALVKEINKNIQNFNENIDNSNKENKKEQLNKINFSVPYIKDKNDKEKLRKLIEVKKTILKELKECRKVFAYDDQRRKIQITPEEVLANYLSQILKYYEENNNALGKEISFVVPDYMSTQEAEYLKYTLSIALDKNVNIYRESEAIVAHYWYNQYKDYFVKQVEQKKNVDQSITKYVVFSNMGESKTSLVYAKLTSAGFEVIDTVDSVDLGGQQIDQMLFEYLMEKFKEEHRGFNINELTPKAKDRIFQAIEKYRKQLTVNGDATFLVESMWRDEDLSITIKKEEYEALLDEKGFLKQYDDLINKLKERNQEIRTLIEQKSPSFKIEMAGDLMRTPIFQTKTEKGFGDISIGKKILIDECCSVGGAILQNFHTKDIGLGQKGGSTILKQITSLKNENEIIDKELLNSSIVFPEPKKVKDFVEIQKTKRTHKEVKSIRCNKSQRLFHAIKEEIQQSSLINNDDKGRIIEQFEIFFRTIGQAKVGENIKYECFDKNMSIIENKLKEYKTYLDNIENKQAKMPSVLDIDKITKDMSSSENQYSSNDEVVNEVNKKTEGYMSLNGLNDFLKKEGKEQYLKQESKILNELNEEIGNSSVLAENLKNNMQESITGRQKKIKDRLNQLDKLQLEPIVESDNEDEEEEEIKEKEEKEEKEKNEREENNKKNKYEQNNKNNKAKNKKGQLSKIQRAIKNCLSYEETEIVKNVNNTNQYDIRIKGVLSGLKLELQEDKGKFIITNTKNNKQIETDISYDNDEDYDLDNINDIFENKDINQFRKDIYNRVSAIHNVIIAQIEKELKLKEYTLRRGMISANGISSDIYSIQFGGSTITVDNDINGDIFIVLNGNEKRRLFNIDEFEQKQQQDKNNKIFEKNIFSEEEKKNILETNESQLGPHLLHTNDNINTNTNTTNNNPNNQENPNSLNVKKEIKEELCRQLNLSENLFNKNDLELVKNYQDTETNNYYVKYKNEKGEEIQLKYDGTNSNITITFDKDNKIDKNGNSASIENIKQQIKTIEFEKIKANIINTLNGSEYKSIINNDETILNNIRNNLYLELSPNGDKYTLQFKVPYIEYDEDDEQEEDIKYVNICEIQDIKNINIKSIFPKIMMYSVISKASDLNKWTSEDLELVNYDIISKNAPTNNNNKQQQQYVIQMSYHDTEDNKNNKNKQDKKVFKEISFDINNIGQILNNNDKNKDKDKNNYVINKHLEKEENKTTIETIQDTVEKMYIEKIKNKLKDRIGNMFNEQELIIQRVDDSKNNKDNKDNTLFEIYYRDKQLNYDEEINNNINKLLKSKFNNSNKHIHIKKQWLLNNSDTLNNLNIALDSVVKNITNIESENIKNNILDTLDVIMSNDNENYNKINSDNLIVKFGNDNSIKGKNYNQYIVTYKAQILGKDNETIDYTEDIVNIDSAVNDIYKSTAIPKIIMSHLKSELIKDLGLEEKEIKVEYEEVDDQNGKITIEYRDEKIDIDCLNIEKLIRNYDNLKKQFESSNKTISTFNFNNVKEAIETEIKKIEKNKIEPIFKQFISELNIDGLDTNKIELTIYNATIFYIKYNGKEISGFSIFRYTKPEQYLLMNCGDCIDLLNSKKDIQKDEEKKIISKLKEAFKDKIKQENVNNNNLINNNIDNSNNINDYNNIDDIPNNINNNNFQTRTHINNTENNNINNNSNSNINENGYSNIHTDDNNNNYNINNNPSSSNNINNNSYINSNGNNNNTNHYYSHFCHSITNYNINNTNGNNYNDNINSNRNNISNNVNSSNSNNNNYLSKKLFVNNRMASNSKAEEAYKDLINRVINNNNSIRDNNHKFDIIYNENFKELENFRNSIIKDINNKNKNNTTNQTTSLQNNQIMIFREVNRFSSDKVYIFIKDNNGNITENKIEIKGKTIKFNVSNYLNNFNNINNNNYEDKVNVFCGWNKSSNNKPNYTKEEIFNYAINNDSQGNKTINYILTSSTTNEGTRDLNSNNNFNNNPTLNNNNNTNNKFEISQFCSLLDDQYYYNGNNNINNKELNNSNNINKYIQTYYNFNNLDSAPIVLERQDNNIDNNINNNISSRRGNNSFQSLINSQRNNNKNNQTNNEFKEFNSNNIGL